MLEFQIFYSYGYRFDVVVFVAPKTINVEFMNRLSNLFWRNEQKRKRHAKNECRPI